MDFILEPRITHDKNENATRLSTASIYDKDEKIGATSCWVVEHNVNDPNDYWRELKVSIDSGDEVLFVESSLFWANRYADLLEIEPDVL